MNKICELPKAHKNTNIMDVDVPFEIYLEHLWTFPKYHEDTTLSKIPQTLDMNKPQHNVASAG